MKNILALLFLVSVFPVLLAEPVDGTVKSNVLNVRVKPGEKYAVVARLSRNDKLKVLGFEKGWYEVAAPQKASVWISSAFVTDGVVSKKANLRTGPSVACAPYEKSVEQGIKVQVLDKTQEGWLRIAPFEGLTAWVNADFVDVDPVQAKTLKNEEQDAPAPDKPEKGEKNNGADNGSSNGKIIFAGRTGKAVSYEGILLPVRRDAATGLVTHAIASITDGQYFPICYIFSRKMNMKLWEEKKIQVSGQERWVINWPKPVVDVDIVNALW